MSNTAESLPKDHEVRFYDRDDWLIDEVCEHLDSALRAGGMAVAIGTSAHRACFAQRLSAFGKGACDITGGFAGRLVMLDAAETLERFMVDGRPDAALFEEALGPVLRNGRSGKPLHAFGEMVALLCEQGNYEGALQLEQIWNQAARRYAFALFCAYPWQLFSSSEKARAFQHVCAAHSRVLNTLDEAAAPPGSAAMTFLELQQQTRALRVELGRRQRAEETLRERERELADFLNNASEGIHKVAGDGAILYANRAELEMLGYRWEEYVGHNIAEFYVDPARIDQILRRLRAGEVLRDEPGEMRCGDGSTKTVLICSNGYFEDGELRYTRCFTRDASERIAREAAQLAAASEREQLLEELREASRAKDEFLAMLGHELRNPLSPIVMALQLMRMRGDTGTAREQGIIQRQVEHLVRLVDDLLDISRITRGNIELKRTPSDVKALLAKAVEQASELLEQRNHELRVDVQPDLRCVCDPVRIAQVVANLLINAARYTEPGGCIELSCKAVDEARFAISVRDNGRGIPREIQPRIFELFYQGPRGIDRAEGGLGIGLALVHSLVGLHGGSVDVQSEGLGRGSEFVVHLPLAIPEAEACAPTIPDDAPAAVGRGQRILLVDDNVDAASTTAQLLRAHGYQVTVCHDPVSALEVVGAVLPEVALLDIGLPVMDGYELGARIRAICGTDCQLVALTGYGQDADKARAREVGFDRHLVKPVAPQDVLETVSAASRR